MTEQPTFSRRNVILAGLGTAVAAVLAACGRSGGGSGTDTAPAQGAPTTTPATSGGPTTPSAPGAVTTPVLAPTPECADADDLTPAQTEGPYFKPNSP